MPITDAEREKMERNFSYHEPTGNKGVRHAIIRGACKATAVVILMNCPESRERSVAITKLEEVMMWANKAIAQNE